MTMWRWVKEVSCAEQQMWTCTVRFLDSLCVSCLPWSFCSSQGNSSGEFLIDFVVANNFRNYTDLFLSHYADIRTPFRIHLLEYYKSWCIILLKWKWILLRFGVGVWILKKSEYAFQHFLAIGFGFCLHHFFIVACGSSSIFVSWTVFVLRNSWIDQHKLSILNSLIQCVVFDWF